MLDGEPRANGDWNASPPFECRCEMSPPSEPQLPLSSWRLLNLPGSLQSCRFSGRSGASRSVRREGRRRSSVEGSPSPCCARQARPATAQLPTGFFACGGSGCTGESRRTELRTRRPCHASLSRGKQSSMNKPKLGIGKNPKVGTRPKPKLGRGNLPRPISRRGAFLPKSGGGHPKT